MNTSSTTGLVLTVRQQHCVQHLWWETAVWNQQLNRPPFTHIYREAKVLQPHTQCTGYYALPHPHTKRSKNRDLHCDAILCKCDARSPVNVTVSCDVVQERRESYVMGELCILYYKHGWDTYLTCSADLCKHTSGCSANMSRLYCPLTSAELLIVNVTQLQRRASTVDWGSLSLTSWLTAANTPLIYPKTWHTITHTHTGTTRPPLFNR